jgi:Trypsin-like peptidase domain
MVTAAHVLDDVKTTNELVFVFDPTCPSSNREESHRGAKLIYYDRQTDLVILTLETAVSSDRIPLAINAEKPLRKTKVTAVGNPALDQGQFSPLEVSGGEIVGYQNDQIIIDTRIREGFSGGPVFTDNRGEVVGIVTAGLSDDQKALVTFLVSAEKAQAELRKWMSLTDDERVRRVATVTEQFVTASGARRLFAAALWLTIAGELYVEICADAVNHFLAGALQGRNLDTVRQEIRDHAAKVRKRVSPTVEAVTKEFYEDVKDDPTILVSERQALQQAYSSYEQLQKDGTTLEQDAVGRKSGVEIFSKRVVENSKEFHDVMRPLLEKSSEAIRN